MKDLDDAVRDAARRTEPPADWLERIEARVHQRRRNRRILAGMVGIGLSLAVFVPFALELASETTPRGGAGAPEAPDPCGVSTAITGLWRWEGTGDDEIAGRTADLTGEGRFAPGVAGEALSLDGTVDFASIPDDPALNVGDGDLTIAMWVRFETTEGEQVLAEDYVETLDRATSTGWTLTKLENNVILFGLGVAGGVSTDPLELPADTWIHIGARRQGGTIGIFINGVETATRALHQPSRTLDSDSSLKFGHRGNPVDTPGSLDNSGFFLKGQIDEVVFVVGNALSDEEIRTLFERPASCAPAVPNIALGKPTAASGFEPGSPPAGAVEGSSMVVWNSGDYAPQWIEIDLGSPRSISRISLLTTQLPDGQTVHRVLGKASEGDTYHLLYEFAGFTANGLWLDHVPPTPWEDVRFIRVESTMSPSWIGWREIQVYPAG